jgi:hypothetical protein
MVLQFALPRPVAVCFPFGELVSGVLQLRQAFSASILPVIADFRDAVSVYYENGD